MLAISPNRHLVPNELLLCRWTNLLRGSMQIAAAVAVLVLPTECAWSQSGSTDAQSGAAVNSTKPHASANEALNSAIHFVTPCENVEHSMLTKPNVAPAPEPVANDSTFVPPLSIAD